jgi:hypothetical protein
MIFELVVVDKCDKEKELIVYVWKYKTEADGKKPPGRQLPEVGSYGLKGIIRDYEIVNTMRRIERGFLNLQLLSKLQICSFGMPH